MMRFAKVLRTALGTRVRTMLVQLRGLGAEGADDAAEAHDNVEVLQPLGLFSRPYVRSTLEALVLELGEELVALLLNDKGAGTMADVEEGETRLYGTKEASARVRLRASGAVNVESKTATDIVLNGGIKAVSRVDDTTANGTLTFALASGPPDILTITYAPPSGAPLSVALTFPLTVFTMAPTTMTFPIAGVITSGATRVKA